MSQCLFCEDSLKVFCKDCQESFCYHCGTLKHLLDNNLHSHSVILLCEECEKEVSSAFCQNCEQNLCHNCDTRIHNRAKRTQHKREPITHSLSVDEIKIIAHLTLDFVKECCEIEDLDQLTEQFNEIISNILETHKGLQKKNILFTSVLNQNLQGQDEMEPTIKTLKDLRLNNFLLLEQEANDDSFDRFLQTTTREESGSQETAEKFESTAVEVYKLNHTFKSASSMGNIYVFDSFRNEAFARILLKQEKLSTKKCFLNFDFTDPNPFIATLYSQSKPRESFFESQDRLTPCSVVKQLQLGNSSCKKKGRSEALASDSFTEGHFDEHNRSMPAQDADLWDRMGSSREIHKKTNQSFDELSLLNASSDHVLQKQKSSHYSSRHHQGKLSICNEQPLKNIELQGSLKLSHFLQQELRKFASKGDLLVTKEDLTQKIKKNLPENLRGHVEDVLRQAEEAKIIHSTIRKFLDIQPLYYIGMLLDRLTIESLTWIVQSIRNDLMTPTEKLILSRIKECYGLKVDANFWKAMINYIFANQTSRQNKANSFEQGYSFPLFAKRILDPVTNTDTFVIYLTYDEWIPEDQGTIPENTQEWRDFAEFIDRFFKEDETSIDQKMTPLARNPSQEFEDASKKAIWSSSVDNVMNRSTTNNNKKDKSLKVTEDVKAIPGGRYGCAQFIKICGPESLKKLSIGRLTLFVQEAINKGILRYQRTLLVKNNPNTDNSMLSFYTEGDASFTMDPILEKKSKILKTVKDILVKVLTENPEGIPLAQIPLHLKKEMDLVINFQELGFPKLKNYLSTLTDLVKIESSGTNHAYVKLIKNPVVPAKKNWNPSSREHLFFAENQESTKNSYMTQQSSQNIMMQSKHAPGYNTSQSGFDSRYSYMESNRMNYNMTTISDSRDSNKIPRRKTLPSEDHLNKVRNLIEEILSEYPNGVVSEKLYKEACLKLGFEFDFTEYRCNTFDDFLMEYVDHLIDIEMKKDCVIIYPKNFRFGPKSFIHPPPTMNYPHMMKQPVNSNPGFYEFDPKRNLMNNQLSLNASPFLLNEPPKFNSMDHDVPPGLTKPGCKPRQPTYNMPPFTHNPAGYNAPSNYPPHLQYRQHQPMMRPNNLNISSQNYYDACEPMYERQMQAAHAHNTSGNMGKMDPNVDYFGGFPYPDDGRQGPGLAHFNFGFPQRPESRGVKTLQEESNADLSENIRFIEEILQDDQSYEKSMTNFTLDKTNESSLMGIQSPNLSFTGLMPLDPMGGFMKQNHSKTQSEDFTTKTGLKFCALTHGRVYSAIPERKNE